MEQARLVLKETFGFESFRGEQEKVIHRLVVDGKNALCLMPTGGGKSLTFQVPALCLEGLTLVVSPLIALMKDQVQALRKRGIEAASMDSSLSTDEMSEVRSKLRNGVLKILYVAPERLNNEVFVSMILDQRIALLAVDEAHCVSEWGPSFRAEYLKVARFAKEIAAERVLTLTATATPSVVRDICAKENGFDVDLEHGVFSTGAYRSNLQLVVQPVSKQKDKISVLVPFLKSLGEGASAIVYVTTHGQAEDLVGDLKSKGFTNNVAFYHAGMKPDERKKVQDDFIDGEGGIVVATIAFGMGIDKANIRGIVHAYLPTTLENYSQEIGRAGRDGLPAKCLLMPAGSDFPILEGFARSNTPSEKSMREWLHDVFAGQIDPADNTLSFALFRQSRDFDIDRNALSLLYANLELEFGLIRAVTPFYSTHKMKPLASNSGAFQEILTQSTPAAEAIRANWKKGPTWYTVDVLAAAATNGTTRQEVVRQISQWEYQGKCEINVSDVMNRYAVLKALPKDQDEIEELAKKLFDQMHEREEADVNRLKGVGDFIRQDECFSHALAKYFGDTTSVPNGRCENCTHCLIKKPLSFKASGASDFTDKQFNFVLANCGVRDDSRLLAKVAFGIRSPRITALGLPHAPCFGILSDCDFNTLVNRFEDECAKVNHKNKGQLGYKKPTAAAAGEKRGAANRGGTAPPTKKSKK
ncbi:RecQ family ATP-dependent DNA helicase [Sporobolomyces salmoneus]|uniref:RecQ family ATP-dependent DNA helicase n=1 Tax=Sporobolomyces salmoneus TaxID=183962 RepID=UPI00317931BD